MIEPGGDEMCEGEILYHYTSIEGLNSIINSRCVWASDCRYLNDQKELHDASEIFLSKFNGKKKEILSSALHWHNISRLHCVFSLSRSPKVLSQWCVYGDDGRGAAIGFYRKYLLGFSRIHPCVIDDCIYDGHEEFLEGVVDRCKDDIDTLFTMCSQAGSALNSFWSLIDENPMPLVRLYGELLKVKNPAFREEQEVRLVISVPIKNIRTRVSKNIIIPYVEHEFLEKDETHMWCVAPEIWLGPKCDKRNEQALRMFCQLGWNINGIHSFDCGYI